jgi:hypothetical protein
LVTCPSLNVILRAHHKIVVKSFRPGEAFWAHGRVHSRDLVKVGLKWDVPGV